MINITNKLSQFIDFLLPISAVLFFIPINPLASSIPATIWVMFNLIIAPRDKRWALWPIAFVILAMARTWWLYEMSQPAAPEDLLLIVASFLAATGIAQQNFKKLVLKPLLILPIILIQANNLPSTPNPFAGRNPTAYLIGILAIISICWLWTSLGKKYQTAMAIITSSLGILLLWRAQSRAALIATVIALIIIWLGEENKRGRLLKMLPLATLSTFIAILSLKFLRPTSVISTTGFDFLSDMGRIQVQNCYLQLPFSGNNRFIYGVGFQNPLKFCQQKVISGVLDHAHNIYIQVWANSGILGIIGLILFTVLIVNQWRKKQIELDPFLAKIGMAAFIYILLQGFFDASILYWPVTQVFTGILLAIPFSKTSTTETELVCQSN